jgi:hypothetical protein
VIGYPQVTDVSLARPTHLWQLGNKIPLDGCYRLGNVIDSAFDSRGLVGLQTHRLCDGFTQHAHRRILLDSQPIPEESDRWNQWDADSGSDQLLLMSLDRTFDLHNDRFPRSNADRPQDPCRHP